jgi:hypothetical protein
LHRLITHRRRAAAAARDLSQRVEFARPRPRREDAAQAGHVPRGEARHAARNLPREQGRLPPQGPRARACAPAARRPPPAAHPTHPAASHQQPQHHPQDVEKLGAKRGVVLQAIKDVLQSLVDDDLVRCERIGVSNFFWSFPSEAAVKLEGEAAGLRARLGAREAEAAALKAQLAESRAGREDSVSAVEGRRGGGGCWSAASRAVS